MTDLSPPHIKKPTNINPCTLNFQSECPFRYKRTIIKTLISRTKLLSSFWTLFLNELKNIKQTRMNNGFPNNIVDTEIKHFISKPEQPHIDNNLNDKQSIDLYYKKQFHSNYKIYEQILKNLIQKNVLPTDPTKKVRLIIYYNKFKTSKLITLPRLLNFLIGPTSYICSNVRWETVSPKKIMCMLVWPLQLFLGDLQCTLMSLTP